MSNTTYKLRHTVEEIDHKLKLIDENKNLLPYPYNYEPALPSYLADVGDGSILANGAYTAGEKEILLNTCPLTVGKKYTISLDFSDAIAISGFTSGYGILSTRFALKVVPNVASGIAAVQTPSDFSLNSAPSIELDLTGITGVTEVSVTVSLVLSLGNGVLSNLIIMPQIEEGEEKTNWVPYMDTIGSYVDERFNSTNTKIRVLADQVGKGGTANLTAGEGENSIVQKTTNEEEKNSAIGAATAAFGRGSIAGAAGYRIIATDIENRQYILENYYSNANNEYDVGDIFSVRISNVKDNAGTIEAIEADSENSNNAIVTVSEIYTDLGKAVSDGITITEQGLVDSNQVVSDMNTFRVPAKPASGTIAISNYSFACGYETRAVGNMSFAEGYNTHADGKYAHAEGHSTTAAYAAHSEGKGTKALGQSAHAEGTSTEATGHCSHAEGESTKASGLRSHAEGDKTEAKAQAAHAEGIGTIASSLPGQHVEGRWNEEDTSGKFIHIVGFGTDKDHRENIHTLDKDGNAWFAGDLTLGKDQTSVLTAKEQELTKRASDGVILDCSEFESRLKFVKNNNRAELELVKQDNSPVYKGANDLVRAVINLPKPVDISKSMRVAAQLYWGGTSATQFAFEFTSSGTSDKNELVFKPTLSPGWNTIKFDFANVVGQETYSGYLGYHTPGENFAGGKNDFDTNGIPDYSRINYIRIHSTNKENNAYPDLYIGNIEVLSNGFIAAIGSFAIKNDDWGNSTEIGYSGQATISINVSHTLTDNSIVQFIMDTLKDNTNIYVADNPDISDPLKPKVTFYAVETPDHDITGKVVCFNVGV